MGCFESAIKVVLDHEGGFSDNPNDPGGATNFGLTLKFLHGLSEYRKYTVEQLKNMDVETATNIYKVHWWDVYGYDRIQSCKIAIKLFDTAINMGQYIAVKLMQQACNKLIDGKIMEDGVMGPTTINAILNCDDLRLLGVYRLLCCTRYTYLISQNPALAENANGWRKRGMS